MMRSTLWSLALMATMAIVAALATHVIATDNFPTLHTYGLTFGLPQSIHCLAIDIVRNHLSVTVQ